MFKKWLTCTDSPFSLYTNLMKNISLSKGITSDGEITLYSPKENEVSLLYDYLSLSFILNLPGPNNYLLKIWDSEIWKYFEGQKF